MIFGWFLAGLGGFWLVWVVFGWFGWFLAGLGGFWLVWVVFGWFRILAVTHNKKQSMWISVSCYGSTSPSPSPGDFCVGLGVQASKETARKLKLNKLLSLSLLDLYWDLLCLARGH